MYPRLEQSVSYSLVIFALLQLIRKPSVMQYVYVSLLKVRLGGMDGLLHCSDSTISIFDRERDIVGTSLMETLELPFNRRSIGRKPL